jgi:hypothetical protein
MDINAVFQTGSPELDQFVAKNQVGASWQAGPKSFRIVKVNIDEAQPPNPFDGKPQTKVVLVLDDA